MFNTTTLTWLTNTTSTTHKTTSLEDLYDSEEVEVIAGNNETNLDRWPYFKITGYPYWSVMLAMVAVGAVGNVMVFILMSDFKLRYLSYTLYMRFLAVTDSVVLGIMFVEETQSVFKLENFVDYNDTICKIWKYFRYSSSLLSPWLVVGLTIDRYVCINFPMYRRFFCTWNKAMITCSVLTAIAALTLVVPAIAVRIINGVCYNSPEIYPFFVLLRLILTSTFPLVLTFIMTVAMIVRIRRSAAFRESCVTSNFNRFNLDKSILPLLLVSMFAIATLLPMAISENVRVILRYTLTNKRAMVLAIELWPVFKIIYLLNFGQNFYVLISSSEAYRQIIRRKLVCLKQKIPSLTKPRGIEPTN